MLVISRKPGEWINIGDEVFIQIDFYSREGKHKGKLRVYIVEVRENSKDKEYEIYLSGDVLDIGNGIGIKFVEKKGDQYKVGINAPDYLYITREDEDGYVQKENLVEDELVDKYRDELSWFFN